MDRHAMGRTGLSGAQAKKTVRGEDLRREREERGIGIRAGSLSGLAEEVPPAYKAVSRVVEVVQPAGLGRKLARLAPIAVTKGEQS